MLSDDETPVRAEREALSRTATEFGPDAPTLCDGWDVRALMVHLLVREGSLVGSPGIVLPPLAFLTDQVSQRLAKQPFADLVERFRSGPPLLSPFSLPGVDRLTNVPEFFVHHEDIRRAGTEWAPRVLSSELDDALWRRLGVAGRGLVRPAGVPIEIRRSDTGATATLRGGAAAVVVTGPVSELTLWIYGREQVEGIAFEGSRDLVRKLRDGRRSL